MELLAADDVVADLDGGILRVGFAADEFVALLDGGDALDDVRKNHGERFERLMGELVADGADDDAGDAAHDVRAVTAVADFLEDGLFLGFGDAGFKDDNHGFGAGWPDRALRGTKKPRKLSGPAADW